MFNEKQVRPAVSFTAPGEAFQRKAVDKIDNCINGRHSYAITKYTQNGKYMRGKYLFYSLNGVEIYTEENNVIFVDTENNTMFIRDHERALEEINPTDPETKQYIMLYTDLGYTDGDEEFPLRWESVNGRSAAYENIKINAPVIDIDKSFVLVESVALKDSLTVRQFMEYIKNGNIIEDESFDINDYSGGDYI